MTRRKPKQTSDQYEADIFEQLGRKTLTFSALLRALDKDTYDKFNAQRGRLASKLRTLERHKKVVRDAKDDRTLYKAA